MKWVLHVSHWGQGPAQGCAQCWLLLLCSVMMYLCVHPQDVLFICLLTRIWLNELSHRTYKSVVCLHLLSAPADKTLIEGNVKVSRFFFGGGVIKWLHFGNDLTLSIVRTHSYNGSWTAPQCQQQQFWKLRVKRGIWSLLLFRRRSECLPRTKQLNIKFALKEQHQG